MGLELARELAKEEEEGEHDGREASASLTGSMKTKQKLNKIQKTQTQIQIITKNEREHDGLPPHCTTSGIRLTCRPVFAQDSSDFSDSI